MQYFSKLIFSNLRTKATLIDTSTLSSTTTTAATSKIEDVTTYYPLIENNETTETTYYPNVSTEKLTPDATIKKDNDKEPRVSAVKNNQVAHPLA